MIKEKIDYRFKFLYCIATILVVAGHLSYNGQPGGVYFIYRYLPIYSYHLALWMFCSGYFYKKNNEENIKGYIIKKIKNLILPFFLFNLIYGVIINVLKDLRIVNFGKSINLESIFLEPIINGHQFLFNMCSWFIVPLFIVEVFNVFFRKIIKIKKEIFYLVIYVILGLIGNYLAYKGFNYDWYRVLARFLYFLPFYEIGIFYKEKIESRDKLNNIMYFSIIFLSVLLIITYVQKDLNVIVAWLKGFTSNIWLPILTGYLGIFFWLRVSKIVEPIVKESKIINLIANNAFNIMIHQIFAIFLIKSTFGIFNKIFGIFSAFNWNKYKSDIWYLYYPHDMKQWSIVYLVSAIFISIGIGKLTLYLKNIILNGLNLNKLKNKFLPKKKKINDKI